MLAYNKRNGIIISILTALIIWTIIIIFQSNFQSKELILNQENIQTENYIEKDSEVTEEVQESKEENVQNALMYVALPIYVISYYYYNGPTIYFPKLDFKDEVKDKLSESFIPSKYSFYNQEYYWEGNIGIITKDEKFETDESNTLNELEIGDIVEYELNKLRKGYEIAFKDIVSLEESEKYLKQTKENKITLVTYLKDKKGYCLCIQANQIN